MRVPGIEDATVECLLVDGEAALTHDENPEIESGADARRSPSAIC